MLDLPVQKRLRTDCFCVIVNSAFVGLLFLIALFTLHTGTLPSTQTPWSK